MNDDHARNGLDAGLLTVPEAARILRISRNLAYELVARNELPSIRLGRVIRIPRAALDTWMDQQTSTSDGASTSPRLQDRHKPTEGQRWPGAFGNVASRPGR